jgi:tetratricopeptide (TPR) repeat protein
LPRLKRHPAGDCDEDGTRHGGTTEAGTAQTNERNDREKASGRAGCRSIACPNRRTYLKQRLISGLENANMSGTTRREKLEQMLADDPDDPFLRYGLAMEHLSQGDQESAVRCFEELLKRSPDYVPGYLQAGQALIRLGRTAEARELLSRGTEVARQQGDEHSAEEMQGFLAGL